MVVRFSFPTDIRFGLGALSELPQELLLKGIKRPLLVTDKFLAGHEMMHDLFSLLGKNGLKPALFGNVFGNPDDKQVMEGCQSYKEARADALIALGGGASIDVAKAIALLASNSGQIADYDGKNPKPLPIKAPLPYLVAAPTTAGTGSEVGRSTVVSDPVSKHKRIIFDPALLPRLVIADPMLTKSLPAPITAATGLDALTHLIESFSVCEFHPLCDGIALEGLHLIGQSLVKACKAAKAKDTSDEALKHRQNMLAASMMGAVAFQKGLGVNHSLAHALSTVCDLHHGLANALVLPHVLQFNESFVPEKYARMATALGAGEQSLPFFVGDLIKQIEIKPTLSAHGVKPEHLNDLVDVAYEDGCHQTNPQKITKQDLRNLIDAAF